MKISKEQKLQNRKALIQAGASLIAEKGFKNASMREIAKKAKMSDAAIYKYFPTKEQLLYAFFENSLDETFASLSQVPDFDEMNFVEQVQLMVEHQLELFANNRDFVEQAYREVFVSNLRGADTEVKKHREKFLSFVQRHLEAAIHAGEYRQPPNLNFLSELFWDWHIGIVYYWLKDTSADYNKTTQIIDKTLGLFHEVLRSELLDKLTDIAFFFIRNHLFERLDHLSELTAPQRQAKKKFLKKEK